VPAPAAPQTRIQGGRWEGNRAPRLSGRAPELDASLQQIRQQNKKKKGKKNKDSKKNVSSNVRIDGFENIDANL
jgi:hypothetical protein